MTSISLDGSSILITGGSGSFGSRFAATILERYRPRRVIIFSRGEARQSDLAESLRPADYPAIRYFIGDVRDKDRLAMAMRGVDFVVHAAAMKQVPASEYNPFECIHTNVIGAENVVQASLQTGVKKVVALSTDKACNPVNLYGASKLASDKIFIAANNLAGADGTRFAVVRYGNVLGSRGSVVPLFRKRVSEGADHIPITDKRMTRFWITLQQGLDFVLSALATMKGGEIMVPKIPSMKITDLATVMAPDLPQVETGIRPGEKLHEIMVSRDDARSTFELPDRYVIQPSFAFWHDSSPRAKVGSLVNEDFSYASDTNDIWLTPEKLRELLQEQSVHR